MADTFITISISIAPLAIASLVSKALVAVVVEPCGNPITVQTFTVLPARALAAAATSIGRMQYEAVLYFRASSAPAATSA